MEKRFEWLWTQLEKLAGDSCNGTERLNAIETGIRLANAEVHWRDVKANFDRSFSNMKTPAKAS